MKLLLLSVFLLFPADAAINARKLQKRLPTLKGEEQVRAIRALGRSKKRKVVPDLLKLFDVEKNAPRQSAALIEALGRLGDERAAPALLSAWAYLDQAIAQVPGAATLQVVREELPEAVGRVGTEAGRDKLLLTLNESGDARMVEKAARGLGELRDPTTREALEKRALSVNEDVSQAAIEALGKIGDKGAIPFLRDLLGRKWPTRVPAAYALVLLRDRQAVGVLEQAMEPGVDGDGANLLAAYYLAKLGNEAGLDHLTMLVGSEVPGNALKAATALGQAGNEKALPSLGELAGHEDSLTRLAAVQAIAAIGGERAILMLKQAQKDVAPVVRNAAKLGLAELGELDD